MDNVGRGTGALEAARQFQGVQPVGELGVPVGPLRREPRFSCKVVELNAVVGRVLVRAAADDHDPALRRGDHQVQKLIDQDEVPQVVGDEVRLDAVDVPQFVEYGAGVADQDIQRRAHGADLLRALHCRLEFGQFEHQRSGSACDACTGLLAPFQRARRAKDVGAAQRQGPHGFVADAGVAARNEGRLAAEVQSGRDVIRGGAAAEFAADILAGEGGGGPQGRARGCEQAALHETASVDGGHARLRVRLQTGFKCRAVGRFDQAWPYRSVCLAVVGDTLGEQR